MSASRTTRRRRDDRLPRRKTPDENIEETTRARAEEKREETSDHRGCPDREKEVEFGITGHCVDWKLLRTKFVGHELRGFAQIFFSYGRLCLDLLCLGLLCLGL